MEEFFTPNPYEIISGTLLELQTRFDQWRADHKYQREPTSDQLLEAALIISRQYPFSLLQLVLRINPWGLMRKAKTQA